MIRPRRPRLDVDVIMAGLRNLLDGNRRAIGRAEPLGRQHVARCAICKEPAAAQEQQPRAEPRCEAEFVHDHEHRAPGRAEFLAETEQFFLIDDVETCRGLVEQQQRRLLCEDFCKQRPLALAARKLAHRPFSKCLHADECEARLHDGCVFRALALPPGKIGIPPHPDDVPHGVGKRDGGLLREIARLLCKRARRKRMDVLPENPDHTAERRLNPAQRLQERALSRAIRPEEPDELAGMDGKGNILKHCAALIAGREMLRLQDRFIRFRHHWHRNPFLRTYTSCRSGRSGPVPDISSLHSANMPDS